MKIGKLPENVLKRSVFKNITHKRQEVVTGAGIGNDCAAFCISEGDAVVVSVDPVTIESKEACAMAVYASLNDIATSGAKPLGILISALLPPETEEKEIKEYAREINRVCEEADIEVLGGDTRITDAVNVPIFTVTAIGTQDKNRLLHSGNAKAGEDVVLTKWIGLQGTALLAKEHEELLCKTLPAKFVETAKGFANLRSILPEAATAAKSGVSAMHDVTEGGIFGSLWELGEAAGVGLSIDLKKIPVRQETIEVCEILELNPYELDSAGSLLITTPDGFGLVHALKEAGILATVIGKTTEGNDRVLYNEEETRFLEPAHVDELYRGLKMEK